MPARSGKDHHKHGTGLFTYRRGKAQKRVGGQRQHESDFYDYLRPKLEWPWIERIENKVNNGTPDIYFRARATSGWIELKYDNNPRPSSRLGLRKEQVVWHWGFHKAGGLSWIILGTPGQCSVWMGKDVMALKRGRFGEIMDLAIFRGQKSELVEWLRRF